MSLQRLEVAVPDETTWNDVNRTFGRNPGIYRVKLKTNTLDGYQPIHRLLGSDPEGVLYIGMSDAIIGRFGGLRAGIYGAYKFQADSGHVYSQPGVHKIGLKMLRGFTLNFPIERLFVQIEGYPLSAVIADDYDVRQHELDVIGNYCKRFGEPPPFNDSWGADLS